MEFLHSFVPVFMKCDFTTSEHGSTMAKNWIECRVNVKPNATNRCIRITIYPKCYSDSMPNFVLDINGTNIDCGPVKSRSKVNVFGVLWSDEQNEKCRMFIAFDNKGMHQNFSKYFKELLALYSLDGGDAGSVAADAAANTEHECGIESPMCNEAVKMTSNSSHPPNASSIQIMRESNASSNCKDAISQPKPTKRSHRFAKSFAVLSGWLKSIRAGGLNRKKIDENSTKVSRTKQTHRKPWSIFKLKGRKTPCDATPSYQHFQEPLNVERPSLAGGNIDMNGYSDAAWYDLNKDEMSLFEARVSHIVSDFNSCSKIVGSTGTNESPNTLWSPNNLSTSCKSNDGNRKPETTQNIKRNHFVRTKPIRLKKSVEQMVLIDDIMTKPIDSDCNGNFDESCKLSSGFGSGESDTNSPREFARKFEAFAHSPATSDFYENDFANNPSNDSNECLPISAAAATTMTTIPGDAAAQLSNSKNMQKMSKKHRTQINSRKLFGIRNEEHMPSIAANVTPQNKSPTECRTKKVRNGTPFKICCSMKPKQMYASCEV